MRKRVKPVSRKTKFSLLKLLQNIANSFAEGIFNIISTIYNRIKEVLVLFFKRIPNFFVYMLLIWAFYFFMKIIIITAIVL